MNGFLRGLPALVLLLSLASGSASAGPDSTGTALDALCARLDSTLASGRLPAESGARLRALLDATRAELERADSALAAARRIAATCGPEDRPATLDDLVSAATERERLRAAGLRRLEEAFADSPRGAAADTASTATPEPTRFKLSWEAEDLGSDPEHP